MLGLSPLVSTPAWLPAPGAVLRVILGGTKSRLDSLGETQWTGAPAEIGEVSRF
jgi:hypothetical protein